MSNDPTRMISGKSAWVRDDEKTRAFDGKTVEIVGRGVFLMHVSETDPNGERRPGFVQVMIEPHDLDAALSTIKHSKS